MDIFCLEIVDEVPPLYGKHSRHCLRVPDANTRHTGFAPGDTIRRSSVAYAGENWDRMRAGNSGPHRVERSFAKGRSATPKPTQTSRAPPVVTVPRPSTRACLKFRHQFRRAWRLNSRGPIYSAGRCSLRNEVLCFRNLVLALRKDSCSLRVTRVYQLPNSSRSFMPSSICSFTSGSTAAISSCAFVCSPVISTSWTFGVQMSRLTTNQRGKCGLTTSA